MTIKPCRISAHPAYSKGINVPLSLDYVNLGGGYPPARIIIYLNRNNAGANPIRSGERKPAARAGLKPPVSRKWKSGGGERSFH